MGAIMDLKKGCVWYFMSFCAVYHRQHVLLLCYDNLRRLTSQWPLDIGNVLANEKSFSKLNRVK